MIVHKVINMKDKDNKLKKNHNPTSDLILISNRINSKRQIFQYLIIID